jgi:hypothetical protein
MQSAVERMQLDIDVLHLAAEQNKDNSWVQSSLIDLMTSHTGQKRRFERSAEKYYPQSDMLQWARNELSAISQAAEQFGAPPIALADWLVETPLSREAESQLSQLVQLRAAVQDALDKGDEPRINDIKKFLRAIARIERQLEEGLIAAGILADSETIDRFMDDLAAKVKEWSLANLPYESWEHLVDTVIDVGDDYVLVA